VAAAGLAQNNRQTIARTNLRIIPDLTFSIGVGSVSSHGQKELQIDLLI